MFTTMSTPSEESASSSTPREKLPKMPVKPVQTGPFGLRVETNGDVLKFGVIALVLGYGLKSGIQLLGVADIQAGQLTTGILSIGSLLAWISTYVFRVGTKSMTYAQQLRDYENAVIEKRYEELTDEELRALRDEVEEDNNNNSAK